MFFSKTLWWSIVASLLVLVTSCDDENKKIEQLIEKQRKEAQQKEEEQKRAEEERKKREEEEKRKEEERKKKEEEERKKREEEEKRKEEERKKKEEEEKQKEAERQNLTGVYTGTRTFEDGEKKEEIFNVVLGKDEGKECLSFAYPNGKETTYLSSRENDKITFYYQYQSYGGTVETITCILIPSTRSLKIVYTYTGRRTWTFEGKKQ